MVFIQSLERGLSTAITARRQASNNVLFAEKKMNTRLQDPFSWLIN
jgi:hypothetical protein